jgi:hypothetical protein
MKFITTILLFVYMATSTGANVHMHFCMGKLKSLGLWTAKKKDGCDFCGMKKRNGCCEDKRVVVKIEKKQDVFVAPGPVTTYSLLPPGYFTNWSIPILPATPVDLSSSTSPPFNSGIPLFIRNCTYRI